MLYEVITQRGQLLRGGDILADESGLVRVQIKAASELVSTVRCDDPLLLTRACYSYNFV